VYKAVFSQQLDKDELESAGVQSEPNGIFARRAWYLYELLMGATLDIADLTSGRYIDLLDQDLHIAGGATACETTSVSLTIWWANKGILPAHSPDRKSSRAAFARKPGGAGREALVGRG